MKSAAAIVASINEFTAPERTLCEELKLKEIKTAEISQQSTEVFYQITIVTSPGDSMFESTVKTRKKLH